MEGIRDLGTVAEGLQTLFSSELQGIGGRDIPHFHGIFQGAAGTLSGSFEKGYFSGGDSRRGLARGP